MTNREQVTFSFEFGDYDNRNIAEIVSDMLEAYTLTAKNKQGLKSGLDCIAIQKQITGAFWRNDYVRKNINSENIYK